MAAAHNDYRSYLRNDVEAGQQRLHAGPSSEPSHRPLLFGTLAVMGLLQVASSVAILLHLTGYLQQVDLSTAPHRPIQEVQAAPVLDALRDPRKAKKPRALPSAHLPIRAPQDFKKKGNSAIVIEWDGRPENLRRMSYRNGKLRVEESGFYYVYANTCFRHYNLEPYNSNQREDPPVDIGNPTQLFQYFYRESIRQNGKEIVLMKTGSSMRWNNTSFNMYCAQQSRGVYLVEGDALFVNVSNAFLLDQEAEKTYFGAIKLGN
ncbi:Tumor necrosis factor ligand superfamily member 11 [Oryzias melastigma]|uniref:Tumor necrosis factor ligand superfamily member 11 n=1 Tax=Oryzias melastigma TaxID=30732 RepID=A0A834CFN8_ORYME|nr:Tumor necrosis factor ligand superfamily member 11 [Oryzias melastigma]